MAEKAPQHALDVLRARGMVEQVTDEEGVRALLAAPPASFYAGFDPTARSLHIGNLLPIMAMAHLQRAGHKPIVLVGGATGMVGDPSGRTDERQMLDEAAVAENSAAIRDQLARFMRFDGPAGAVMVNNHDWMRGVTVLEWLRDTGKQFTVNAMIAKESVRRRLEDRDHGISYTEFSYMLLQAYDFRHLFDRYGCRLQVGGSDQWGNITAGIELVRRTRQAHVHGVTFPLVTTASGEKFGKSAGNAVWLDAGMTSPYQFYQYWMGTDDRDVERYLHFFTFLDANEVREIVDAHGRAPEKRQGQRTLAGEATRIVHGDEALAKALRATEILFGREIEGLADADLAEIFADVPATKVARGRLDAGLGVVDLLAETGVCKSKSEARRAVGSGGIYVNNRRVDDVALTLGPAHLASETTLVLRSGKKRYHLVRFE